MDREEFKVGDKVEFKNRWDESSIGIITKITEKRKDITVDFGRQTGLFDSHGWQKGCDRYYRGYIKILTPEREQEIRNTRLIESCKKEVEKADITVEQARQILAILKGSVT